MSWIATGPSASPLVSLMFAGAVDIIGDVYGAVPARQSQDQREMISEEDSGSGFGSRMDSLR
jgi:hypothetical protein